jgi:hypothetical protein
LRDRAGRSDAGRADATIDRGSTVNKKAAYVNQQAATRKVDMNEQQNVEAVRRIYQLTNAGDLTSVLNMVSDDVELFLFGSAKVPWAGHWQGRQGAEQFLIAMGKAAEVKDIPDVVVRTGDFGDRYSPSNVADTSDGARCRLQCRSCLDFSRRLDRSNERICRHGRVGGCI